MHLDRDLPDDVHCNHTVSTWPKSTQVTADIIIIIVVPADKVWRAFSTDSTLKIKQLWGEAAVVKPEQLYLLPVQLK